MTRTEKVATAQELRAQGLLLREIGERMGVSPKTVDGWLSDPDLAKYRARRKRYQGRCMDCGAPTNGSGGYASQSIRCALCDVANRFVPATQARGMETRELVERLWAEGLTAREIGLRLGWTCAASTYIANLRSRGYDLPHRRTPEQIARITRGADEHLAKARSMRRVA